MQHRITVIAAVFSFTAASLPAQRPGGGGGAGGGGNPPIVSLKTLTAPPPTGLDQYVQDASALVALGKALFWDMQTGSDGTTACATCHFHAGGDHRLTNELSGAAAVVNTTLSAADFPFHQLSNPGNNRSTVVRDKRQVAGSMGVIEKTFLSVGAGNAVDLSTVADFVSPFQSNGVHTRQVTARNAPSVINAVYNVRNFWDGRASSIFTGATPFGDSDPGPHAWVYRNGALQDEAVRMQNASLASQATGPILSSVEMSWAGRDWATLGRKMLSLPPLARQKVAADDSVLGLLANPDGNGLLPGIGYAALIRAAFRPEYWSVPDPASGPLQIEHNFGLFWGLAIQAYESTLVANDSRVDQFLEGRAAALTAIEQQGLQEFRNGGAQCTNCHNGAELSAAGFTNLARRNGNVGNAGSAGFFRLGVTPIADDVGIGGVDGFGLPLIAQPGGAQGAFKVPGLRNVELTGPYFHDGGQATLEQVVQFYARNGDFPAGGNLGPGIGNIRLNQGDQTAIVAFLKALTDDRVRFQRAPFDHPSLCVPNGHVQSSGQFAIDPSQDGLVALDTWALVSEVGKNGASVPLQTFEELLAGVGSDGSRANNMTRACVP